MTETIFDRDPLDVYRLPMKFNGVAVSQAEYNSIDGYDHEHRCAEHEGKPEQRH